MAILYIINAEDTDIYKIGITQSDAEKRMKELQTGCPHKLYVKSFYEVRSPWDDERLWHDTFQSSRMQGEWFRLEKDDLKKIHNYYHKSKKRGAVEWVKVTDSKMDFLWGYEIATGDILAPPSIFPCQNMLYTVLMTCTGFVSDDGEFMVEIEKGIAMCLNLMTESDWTKTNLTPDSLTAGVRMVAKDVRKRALAELE